MHGVILFEFQKFAIARIGRPAWGRVLRSQDLGGVLFTPVQTYDDAETASLVEATAKESGVTPSSLLESFGEAIVPDLLSVYGPFVVPEWGFLDLLENAENVIHQAIRLKDPVAAPPILDARRVDAGTLEIAYASPRRMCSFAKGLVRGIASIYGASFELYEATCMKRGETACRLVVTVTG